MSRWLNSIGFYREIAEHRRLDESKTSFVTGTKVTPHEEIGSMIHFKYSNGEGLNSVEMHLFENWVVESGNLTIETNSQRLFQKGEKIVIDGSNVNSIVRVMIKQSTSKNIRRKKTNSKRTILFIG